MQHPVNLLADQRPAAKRQFGDQRPLEPVVEVERLLVIAVMVGQYRQRQLGRATAAIAPFESGRPVIPQVEPGIEPTAIHGDDDGIPFAATFIPLHGTPPSSCCTSSALKSSGCWPSSSKT